MVLISNGKKIGSKTLRLLGLALLFFCSTRALAENGFLSVTVNHDSVTIYHLGTWRNCAAKYRLDIEVNQGFIRLIERDTSNAAAYCNCHFDLSATFGPLPAGHYEAEVIGFDYESGADTLFFGRVSFNVGLKITPHALYQSSCLDNDLSALEIQVGHDTLYLSWNTPPLNCGLKPCWDSWLVNDTFFVAMIDTGLPADCLCSFKLQASFAPIPPGNYVLSFLPDEYGYLPFTISGDNHIPDNCLLAFSQSECYDIVAVKPATASKPPKIGSFQNFPNPFNTSTMFYIELPATNWVKIQAFDLNGNLVQTIFSNTLSSGIYRLRWDTNHLASGTYLVTLSSGSASKTIKVNLIK